MIAEDLVPLAIGQGRLGVFHPKDWPFMFEGIDSIKFWRDRRDRRSVALIRITTYDAPEYIASGDLRELVADPSMKEGSDFRVTGIADRLFRMDMTSDAGNPQVIFRRVMVLDQYVRIADFVLQGAPQERRSDEWERLTSITELMADTAAFADEILQADRIGPSSTLKQTSVGGFAHFRLPIDWKRDRNKNGRILYEPETDPDESTLWVDWDVTNMRTPAPEDVERELAATLGEARGALRFSEQRFKEHGEANVAFCWRRLFIHGEYAVILHFNYVIGASNEDRPHFRQTRELLERELQNVLIDTIALDEMLEDQDNQA